MPDNENTFNPFTEANNANDPQEITPVIAVQELVAPRRGRRPRGENVTPTQAITQTPTRPRSPRVTARPLNEIIDLPAAKLTDPEKVLVIEALKEELAVATQQRSALESNCKSAYEQHRQLQDAVNTFMAKNNSRKGFLRQAINTFYQTALMALEEDN